MKSFGFIVTIELVVIFSFKRLCFKPLSSMRQSMRDHSPVRRGMHPSATHRSPSPTDDDSKHKRSYDSTLDRSQGERPTPRDIEKQNVPAQGRNDRRNSKWANKEDPFGDEEGSEIKYRTMRWWQAAASELTGHVHRYPSSLLSSHDRRNDFPWNSLLTVSTGTSWNVAWDYLDLRTRCSGYVYRLCVRAFFSA